MIDEARTVAWKEWKEWLSRPEKAGLSAYMSRSGNVTWRQLIVFPVVGIILPLQFGDQWFNSAWPVGLWVFLSAIPAAIFSADSFAGERERQTLESLLATPLSDRGILLGKMAAGVMVAWLAALMIPVIGLVTANISGWDGSIRLYSPTMIFSGLVLSALVALLVVAIGSMTSLRSATVQEATMNLMLPLMIPTLLLAAGTALLPRDVTARIFDAVSGADPVVLGLAVAVVLALLDFALVRLALARFQRRRLISRV
jgi:ABC-2 type transport system permease protein